MYMKTEYAPNRFKEIFNRMRTYCNKVKPFVSYYSKLIHSYNMTAHNILQNEIRLLLPQVSRQNVELSPPLVSSFIGLVYEGISSFLEQKCEKLYHKAVNAMSNQVNIQHNKLMKLDNTMLIYGIYNAEMLEKLLKQ